MIFEPLLFPGFSVVIYYTTPRRGYDAFIAYDKASTTSVVEHSFYRRHADAMAQAKELREVFKEQKYKIRVVRTVAMLVKR